jgi:hypothetical protein
MEFVSDCDVWSQCPSDWLWIYDKVIIARKQHLLAAPAGIPVPRDGEYIIRPITNLRMMGRGAKLMFIHKGNDAVVPDGFFWSEVLEGRHISVDFHWGQQSLAVEGFRDNPERLDRFNRWIKVSDRFDFPAMLRGLETKTPWINVEYIGDKIIEIHLRYNDDFANHDSDEIVPVWRGETVTQPMGWSWYSSSAGERLGFWVKNK